MDQNQWSAAACFDIMNLCAEDVADLVDFRRGCRSSLRRASHDREQANQQSKAQNRHSPQRGNGSYISASAYVATASIAVFSVNSFGMILSSVSTSVWRLLK